MEMKVGCLGIHTIPHPAKLNIDFPALLFLSASLQSVSAKGRQKYIFLFLFFVLFVCFIIYTLISLFYIFMIMCFLCFGFQSLGPEFAKMADEPHIILELPGSIVVNFILIS